MPDYTELRGNAIYYQDTLENRKAQCLQDIFYLGKDYSIFLDLCPPPVTPDMVIEWARKHFTVEDIFGD